MTARLDYRLWFWASMGPALLLATSLLCPPLLMVAAMVAAGLGTLLQWRGLVGGLALLGVMAFFELHHVETRLWWHILLVSSVALSVVVASFGFFELVQRVSNVQVEARTHLQRYLHLDEEFKRATASWQQVRSGLEEREESYDRAERLERVKVVELEALQAERDDLIEQVRAQRTQLAQSEAPDGHWRARIAELEEQLDETSVALAEARGRVLDGEEARGLRAQLDVLREQLSVAQQRAGQNAGLRRALNEVRVDRHQLQLDLERKPRLEDQHLEVLELEQIVGNLIEELQKRSTPMLTAVKPSKSRSRRG